MVRSAGAPDQPRQSLHRPRSGSWGLFVIHCPMTLTEDAKALLARIVAEPGKMGGKPVIRGRRITPAMVLAMLARGATRADVLEAYPALEAADIDACLLYGAQLAERADADGLMVAAE